MQDTREREEKVLRHLTGSKNKLPDYVQRIYDRAKHLSCSLDMNGFSDMVLLTLLVIAENTIEAAHVPPGLSMDEARKSEADSEYDTRFFLGNKRHKAKTGDPMEPVKTPIPEIGNDLSLPNICQAPTTSSGNDVSDVPTTAETPSVLDGLGDNCVHLATPFDIANHMSALGHALAKDAADSAEDETAPNAQLPSTSQLSITEEFGTPATKSVGQKVRIQVGAMILGQEVSVSFAKGPNRIGTIEEFQKSGRVLVKYPSGKFSQTWPSRITPEAVSVG